MPAAHVVDLGQVLHPQRVDRPHQDQPLDRGPVLLADLGLLGVEPRVGEVAHVLGDRLAAAEVPQLVGRRALAGQAHLVERVRQPFEVPLVGIVAREVGVDEDVDLLVEERLDGLGQVLVVEDLVALGVDRLALLVDDVVELDDALADVEVEALDAALGGLDRPRHEARLDRDVVLEAEPLHQPGDPLAGEALHQVVFERQVEARRARVALASGAAAELVVDPAGVVAFGADDVEPARLDHADRGPPR